MLTRTLAALAAVALLGATAPAFAQQKTQEKLQEKFKVVASFSILGDFVKTVGGDRVDVVTLVGPNSDTHVYSPAPADAAKVAAAKLVVINGLGLEGWMGRLGKAAGKPTTVIATAGIKPLKMEDEHKPGQMVSDPHAWQSVANAKIYVANIRDALIKADADGKATYEANAAAYLTQLDALEREVRETIARIPADRRRIITSHDAFGYFAAAYGLDFIAPAGVSTEAEASAKDVAKIIAQIRKQKIPAVFLENVSDPRLITQIARESGAKIGGKLYSDALSKPGEGATTYLEMMRNNINAFAVALTG